MIIIEKMLQQRIGKVPGNAKKKRKITNLF